MANEIEPRAAGPAREIPSSGTPGASYLRIDAIAGADAGLSGEIVVSAAAYRLHFYAISDSVMAGAAGVVADSYLAEQQADGSLVRELVAAGLWTRTEEGFRLHDEEGVEHALADYEAAGAIAAVCLTGLGHAPDDSNPGYCAICHGPLPALDD